MANDRSRKRAPTTPGVSDTSDEVEDTIAAEYARSTAAAAKAKQTRSKKATVASTVETTPAKAKPAKAAGSAGRRFGDGAKASSTGKKSPPTRSGGRGGRSGRSAPAVRVAAPRPWGTIAATVAVLIFAAAAIGYAVYSANEVPNDPADIEGITNAEYVSQPHITTDETYEENPPIGGLHDAVWADCDGAVYDEQIRSENAVHSLEHGAVWITYNPDEVSQDDIGVLSEYVVGQEYIMMSPYAGLPSPISLQSWNHQIFVDSVDDPRISEFITVLKANPEEHPEVGASCTQPSFLANPVLEGEPAPDPSQPGVVTDAPAPPAVPTP